MLEYSFRCGIIVSIGFLTILPDFLKVDTLAELINNAFGKSNDSLTQDYYRGISGIRYNLLNLPERIQFMAGHSTSNTYDASGVKRRTVHTSYTGSYTVPLGSIVSPQSTPARTIRTYGHHYYLKDHLGNNRTVMKVNGTRPEIVQEVNYYPFGMPHPVLREPRDGKNYEAQRFKFGGKEYDEMHNLHWYDFHARQLDGIIPRFTTMDPMAEKYYHISPYAYCANNPVRYIDPDGMENIGLSGDSNLDEHANRYYLDDAIHIFAHGTNNLMQVSLEEGKSEYIENAENLLEFLLENSKMWDKENSENNKNRTIVLHSCSTGKEDEAGNSLAKTISSSDIFADNPIVAPDDVYGYSKGNKGDKFMGVFERNPDATSNIKINESKPGNWVMYISGEKVMTLPGNQRPFFPIPINPISPYVQWEY